MLDFYIQKQIHELLHSNNIIFLIWYNFFRPCRAD